MKAGGAVDHIREAAWEHGWTLLDDFGSLRRLCLVRGEPIRERITVYVDRIGRLTSAFLETGPALGFEAAVRREDRDKAVTVERWLRYPPDQPRPPRKK